jgi:hypothetical protein
VKTVTAYKCDHCGRCFLRPCNAVQHESSCNANPARRNCKTCVHGCYGLVQSNTNNRVEMVPYCDYHKVPIFEKPYNIECESSMRYGDEVPDAGTCYYYEYKGKRGWTQKDAPTGAESE